MFKLVVTLLMGLCVHSIAWPATDKQHQTNLEKQVLKMLAEFKKIPTTRILYIAFDEDDIAYGYEWSSNSFIPQWLLQEARGFCQQSKKIKKINSECIHFMTDNEIISSAYYPKIKKLVENEEKLKEMHTPISKTVINPPAPKKEKVIEKLSFKKLLNKNLVPVYDTEQFEAQKNRKQFKALVKKYFTIAPPKAMAIAFKGKKMSAAISQRQGNAPLTERSAIRDCEVKRKRKKIAMPCFLYLSRNTYIYKGSESNLNEKELTPSASLELALEKYKKSPDNKAMYLAKEDGKIAIGMAFGESRNEALKIAKSQCDSERQRQHINSLCQLEKIN